MDYSVIIPVFNKAALTRQCLETIRPTLEGAGEGEIIVIDNASSDETPEMLEAFPWVRVVRNEKNLGFAGANNQGAALARGEFLVLLNNDTVAHAGWLASMLALARKPGVGAVGARLLYPNGAIQHAGVRVHPVSIGLPGFQPFHDLAGAPGDDSDAAVTTEMQIVTGACLVTPRALYAELGGLDEGFWNGYEDVDYCLKLRDRGLHVVYDAGAALTHFESQSGAQRFRKVAWNVARLAQRWNGKVVYDAQNAAIRRGIVRRVSRPAPGIEDIEFMPIPTTTIVCFGETDDRPALEKMLRANRAPVQRVMFVPQGDAVSAARAEMEVRGDRYLAFVDARSRLQSGWLDELVAQVEFSRNCAAATYAPELELSQNTCAFTADARCTLLRLAKLPAHLRLEEFPTLSGSLADLLVRALQAGAGTRGSAIALGELPELDDDPLFARQHGVSLRGAVSNDLARVEAALRARPGRRSGLVSIVMLSWNAPQFTKMALESIRAYTAGEYEVIIVDNGSGPETVDWLRTLSDVRVIFNPTNRGYAGGNNQAIAAARGEYVVLLNNDVIVTQGWLEGLLGAFDRIPALGVSAPRSNRIAGDQITPDALYQNIEDMHVYAGKRRERFAGEGYLTDRAIGLCLCIDRRLIEEVGGIDERFGVGNFEDDDFCMRVRAAGYHIYVCDDVFIHHFGSQTFAANKVDWTGTMRENWKKFAQKWGYPQAYPEQGYVTAQAISRGYDRRKHYVALPALPRDAQSERAIDLAFTASVADERDWSDVGAFVRRYVQAFSAQDATLLKIAAAGDLTAAELGRRVEKLLARLHIDPSHAPDVEIGDATLAQEDVAATRVIDVRALTARNPSALRRTLQEVAE
ncbi:MAG TPA: glycosyltransferase family 2 protein [Candidatus Baltobacteraceae bacterium]|nr:glycosyltransferase family 2 protein [Candidatus Baltobacteraceae bacterium]